MENYIKALKMIDECLNDGIPIEKNDPIHKQVKSILSAPLATDNTLPPEPEDVLRKIEDKYVCRLEEDAAAIAVYAMQAYAKQERQKVIQECIEVLNRFNESPINYISPNAIKALSKLK